jgi:hypothetical protein
MAAGLQEQQMTAEGIFGRSNDVRESVLQEEQVPDKQCIATLQKQITEQQEAYALLYNRNVLLYTELTEANQTIERLSTLSNPTAPHAS